MNRRESLRAHSQIGRAAGGMFASNGDVLCWYRLQAKTKELKSTLNSEFRLIHELCVYVLCNTRKVSAGCCVIVQPQGMQGRWGAHTQAVPNSCRQAIQPGCNSSWWRIHVVWTARGGCSRGLQ